MAWYGGISNTLGAAGPGGGFMAVQWRIDLTEGADFVHGDHGHRALNRKTFSCS